MPSKILFVLCVAPKYAPAFSRECDNSRVRGLDFVSSAIAGSRANAIMPHQSATMPLAKSKTSTEIRTLNEVGRYAVGIQWADGHDSIYPYENLRRYCPCNTCGGRLEGEIPPASQRLAHLSRLGDKAVFLGWADGHETLYTTAQLRDLCGCAHCVSEPEKPITGS